MAFKKEDRSSSVVNIGDAERLSEWMEESGLMDATADLGHSYFGNTGLSLVDRIFISADLVDVKAFNGYSMLSDHSPVGIQWDVVRGSFWRMNAAILKDDNWVEGLKGVIADIWAEKSACVIK